MTFVDNNWLQRLKDHWQNSASVAAEIFPEDELLHLHSASPWAIEKLSSNHHWLTELWPRLNQDIPAERESLELLVASTDLDSGLRKFRNREMLRIIWRDLNQKAETETTLSDLSYLAELSLQYALEKLQDQLSAEHGHPVTEDGTTASFAVLAMGKLGGGELNLSSDIDLIFFHTGHGKTSGNKQNRGSISNEQYFNRLGQRLIKTLSSIQAEGFVFRVDTRLRPHGQSGPLVPSAVALEQYYQNEGRDWERYALIKARPVAGDINSANALLEQLRPFIYRRYLDYGAIESLREMHQLIRTEADKIASKSTLGIDLKRGSGGIREAEFFVQSFQLLRGGQIAELRQSSFLTSLIELQNNQLLELTQAKSLRHAYMFLRQMENRLQALHDQQIHHLPSSEKDQQCLTQAMRLDSWGALLEALELQKQIIQQLFASLFNDQQTESQLHRYQALMQAEWQQAGINLASDTLNPLNKKLEQLKRAPLSPRARDRSQRLLERVLHLNLTTPLSVPVWEDLLSFIIAVSRRSAYLALLIEHPHALERLLQLFAQSDWLATEVIRYPVLLDELIDPKLNQPADARTVQSNLQRISKSSENTETLLEKFNQYKRGQQLRIAVAELSDELTSHKAQYYLSQLADCLLDACLSAVIEMLQQRHGRVAGLNWTGVAYGSLGANEMTYASDLDLVFLFQLDADTTSPQHQLSDGDRPLGAEQYASRIGQRLIAFLTTLTPAGRLYSVDSRLRPNGKSGTLVSRLDAFAQYQEKSAWVWEHQALTRARAVCGSQQLVAQFEKIRIQILNQARPSIKTLRQEIVSMRHKMREQLEMKTHYQQLKHEFGGLGDIEFIAQYGVLAHASQDPRLLLPRDSCGQLEALGKTTLLDKKTTDMLIAAWIQLSRSRQQLTLQRRPEINISKQGRQIMQAVQSIWHALMETESFV